jgi:hypothetical protein
MPPISMPPKGPSPDIIGKVFSGSGISMPPIDPPLSPITM